MGVDRSERGHRIVPVCRNASGTPQHRRQLHRDAELIRLVDMSDDETRRSQRGELFQQLVGHARAERRGQCEVDGVQRERLQLTRKGLQARAAASDGWSVDHDQSPRRFSSTTCARRSGVSVMIPIA